MNLRISAAAIIYIGSYLPLSMILLAQNYDPTYLSHPICWGYFSEPTSSCVLPLKNPIFSVGIFVACLVCFLVALGALATVPTKREINIHKSKHVPAELMNYVLPYVVAFMNLDYSDRGGGRFFGFIIFLAWIFWITYKSGQIIVNPLLTVFGWKLYDIEYSHIGSQQRQEGICLAKSPVMPGERYRYGAIQDVTIVKREGEPNGRPQQA